MTVTDPAAAQAVNDFLGLPIAELSFSEVVDSVFARADAQSFSFVVTPNVDHVVQLDRLRNMPDGRAFAAAYEAAALVLCDSRILQKLARLSGRSLPLVAGSDLTRALLTDPRAAKRTVAVVGGSPDLLSALAARVPQIRFVQHTPPMSLLRDEAAMAVIVRFVAEMRADIVFFAVGAPQSEIVAHRCLQAAKACGVGLCVGASFEFIVGHKRRAPRWVQQLSLEWAFRLLSEPRRLWRRYLVEGPRILAIWARHR